MPKLSRTKIATYFASEIVNGKPDVVTRLAALLLDTHRTNELDLIVADIETALSAHGIILADVTSAHALTNGFEDTVRRLLSAGTTDRIILREHIDADLIGGIKIRAAGRELDATVRHRLMKLKASAA